MSAPDMVRVPEHECGPILAALERASMLLQAVFGGIEANEQERRSTWRDAEDAALWAALLLVRARNDDEDMQRRTREGQVPW